MSEASNGGSLVVVGTGIQWAGQTTLAARRAIERADRVLFAVADPWAARWVRSLNPSAEALPYSGGPRRRIYREMVDRILSAVRSGANVCAVFYGHPGVFAMPAHESVRRARAEGFCAKMLPGVSALDCLFADLGVDPGGSGCQIYEATDFLLRARPLDIHTPLVLFQIGLIGERGTFDASKVEQARRGLDALTEILMRRYPATHEVVVYEASAHPIEPPRMDRVALGDLAGMAVSDLSTLYVPVVEPAAVDAEMLARLGMERPRRAGVGADGSTDTIATT